jgi:predicted DNA-binding transcriptional regulator YafY
VNRGIRLATASRDGHLALRRVERQQALIERLHAAHGERIQLADLARDLGVSVRTVARDIERLRLSGVPLRAHQGRGGGVSLRHTNAAIAIVFDLPEAAALMSSFSVLGPTVSESAMSAMRKLADALNPTTSTVHTTPATSPPGVTAGAPPISGHAKKPARARRSGS